MSKILLLGPGATRLGDADAFDMAIAEARGALVLDGHEVIIVTPRLSAPVCAAEDVKLYIEPLTAASVRAIIAKERPDHVLAQLGGPDARQAIDPAASEPVDARHDGDGPELEVVVALDASGATRSIATSELVGGRGIAACDAIAVVPAPIDEAERALAETAAHAAVKEIAIGGGIFTMRVGLAAGAARVLAVRSWYTRGVAFAAHATGLDLGAAHARLTLGATLDDVVVLPSLLPCVIVRVPRFSFEPFGPRLLDGAPKSTGETHGVGATFHEAWLKAVRALDRGLGNALPPGAWTEPCDGRLEHALVALRAKADRTEVARGAEVRPWVIRELDGALAAERTFLAHPEDRAAVAVAKRAGFSDRHLGALVGQTEDDFRTARHANDVVPQLRVFRNYIHFLSYHAGAGASASADVVVAGAGPMRIGHATELENCTLESLARLRERGLRAVLVHSAPRSNATVAAAFVCVDAPDDEAMAEVSRLVSGAIMRPLAPVDRSSVTSPASAIKVDVDLLVDAARAVIVSVVEYVERAGVHAGDSAAFLPPQLLAPELQRIVEDRAKEAALALGRPGAVRVRAAIVGDAVALASVVHGASTTLALASRVAGESFSGDAIDLLLGGSLERGDVSVPSFVVARESVLPFRLLDAEDTRLGAVQCSVGEAVGFADTMPRAYAKALAAVGVALSRPTVERPIALLALAEADKSPGVEVARRLRALGFELRALGPVASMLRAIRIPYQDGTIDSFTEGDIGLALVTATTPSEVEWTRGLRRRALGAGVPCVTTIELALAVCAVLEEAGNPPPSRFR
ncbi:hypothetical protein BH09MYX1_BH09MYX1_14520 [soil metagenome]